MRLDVEASTDPADYGFAHRVRPRFAETDAMGIVHHAAYLPYLEEARIEYLRSIGRPYAAIREDGLDITVLEVFTRYRRPLRFDDAVDVHVGVGSTTRTTLQLTYLLTVDAEVRATAATVHGVVDRDGRPQRMPEWLRALETAVPTPAT